MVSQVAQTRSQSVAPAAVPVDSVVAVEAVHVPAPVPVQDVPVLVLVAVANQDHN